MPSLLCFEKDIFLGIKYFPLGVNKQCIVDSLGDANQGLSVFTKQTSTQATIMTNDKSVRIETHFSNVEIKVYPNQIKLTSQTLPAKNMNGGALKPPQGFQTLQHLFPPTEFPPQAVAPPSV